MNDFKKFILRGNVVDLAVGVVIGAAFSAVVSSLVKDFLTPLIAAFIKTPDFSSLAFTIRGSKFTYGDFLNNLISFLLVATAVYFFVVLPLNKLIRKKQEQKPATKKCPECLIEIPLEAKRCAYCTSNLAD